MKVGDIFGLIKQTFQEWGEDKASRLGASLAYYTIFSIGPLLLITIAIASFVFANAQDQIVGTISGVVGNAGGEVITQTIDNANKGGANIIATTIGLITLLLGASGVFGQLKDALNTIWEVEPKPGQGILATIKARFFSFTMVLGTGFLLLVSLVVNAAVASLGTYLNNILPGGQLVGQILSVVLTFVIITVMFALLFKFLPDVKIAWSDVWIGAAITSVLFGLGQLALSFYLSLSNVGSAFGATGSLVVVLVWIYYSAQIMLLGAEFTQVYTNKYGSRVRPAENARFVTDDARAQQGMGSEDKKAKPDKKPRQLRSSPWFN
ncbi:MAG TPA: YihY/virulence factor BrkB family protein [Chloroflexia bacterium]|nr:YihY/virulence factor BrkB family protein [Chloroflexia bacterium]